jgi:hypothetical protein
VTGQVSSDDPCQLSTRACGEITNWEWAILEPRLWFPRRPDGRRRPLRDAEADLIDWRLDCCHRFNPSRKSSSTRLWKQRGRSRWILRKSPNSILACSRSISVLAKPSAKQARRINVIFRVGSTRVSRRTARSSRCRRSSPCYLGTRATLHVIEGADHSFHVLKEIQPDGFRRDTRVRRVAASWAELALHQK